jgi:hypothetical protein
MALLGSVLRSTAKIGHHLDARKKFDYSLQTRVLEKLLVKSKDTQFGHYYDFKGLISSENPLVDFAHRIPIFEYADFYDKWLVKALAGEKDVTWPGRINYFALSSGTSGSPSKRIPVSDAMIKAFQRVSLNQMITLHDYGLDTSFYEKSMLIIGGSTKLKSQGHNKEGDLSGILSGKIPFWFSRFSKPGKKVRKLANWDEKLEAIVSEAPNWDIGIISGVPAWVEIVLKSIIERYKLQHIHDLWPSLHVYAYGGVSIEPYRAELLACFGREVYFQETYLASEGYFAYQKKPGRNGMRLLLNSGVYFEFIQFNDQTFDSDGKLIPGTPAIPLHEVKEGVEYALVISTCSGLWRYLIGDTIRFTRLIDYEIEITGRVTHFLSVCGEHLSVSNMNDALARVGMALGIAISEFTVYSTKADSIQHHWFVGTDNVVDFEVIQQALDAALKALNDDYAAVRNRNLLPPLVMVLPRERFTDFLAQQGRVGGQNKFPRVLIGAQIDKWEKFLRGN